MASQNLDKITWIKKYFSDLCQFSFKKIQSGEELSLSLQGEITDYIRWNQSKVRQTTSVNQFEVEIRFQSNGKKTRFTFPLSAQEQDDQNFLATLVQRAREEVTVLPVDPTYSSLKNNGESHDIKPGKLESAVTVIDHIQAAANHVDLAGLYCGGWTVRANQNHLGQNHFFASENFFFDYSLYVVNEDKENKAIKGLYAGSLWTQKELAESLNEKISFLPYLKKKTVNIKRGKYRVYLAPSAVNEILGVLTWGAFSLSAYKQKRSPFKNLIEKKTRLHPSFNLTEDFETGLCPQFNGLGEVSQKQLTLIKNGSIEQLLVSSNSSQEYKEISNFAEEHEFPRSPKILPGTLNSKDVLSKLNTGIYIGNLHYLNWSDIQNARFTGMTRYACFWVENGKIQGPISDLRFDDHFDQLFGMNLEELGQDSVIEMNTMTYESRYIGGASIPGALIKEMTFTL